MWPSFGFLGLEKEELINTVCTGMAWLPFQKCSLVHSFASNREKRQFEIKYTLCTEVKQKSKYKLLVCSLLLTASNFQIMTREC